MKGQISEETIRKTGGKFRLYLHIIYFGNNRVCLEDSIF